MIISDLSYLEVVSEVPNIIGGAAKVRLRTNEIEVTQTTKIKVKGNGDTTASPSISIIASNDDL